MCVGDSIRKTPDQLFNLIRVIFDMRGSVPSDALVPIAERPGVHSSIGSSTHAMYLTILSHSWNLFMNTVIGAKAKCGK